MAGNRARLRIETNPNAVFQFLQLNSYPYFWAPQALSVAIVVRAENDAGETLGYFWGHWVDTGVLAFHACHREGTRFPIFTSDIIAQLVLMAFWIGADELVTTLLDHPNPGPVVRFLKRLGFEEGSDAYGFDTFLSLNTWTYEYGRRR